MGYKTILLGLAKKIIPPPVKKGINKNPILKRYWDRLRRVFIKPKKSPRVFLKKGLSPLRFYEILHERKIEYVLLRWWENFPHMPEGEDMDILVRDEHRDLLNDLLTIHNNGVGMKCDIYTIAGSKHGCRRGLPYFQSNLGHTLIETRRYYRGVFVPDVVPYFASLAYHALFHKGFRSGLPGFDQAFADVEHNYTRILAEEARKLGLNIEISVQGIYQWLKEMRFAPAEDTLTKLVKYRSELGFLQERLFSDIRGGDLLVYVIRERLLNDGYLGDFLDYLKREYFFDIVDVHYLSDEEKAVCKREIRGGKWDKGPFKFSGGNPVAFVVAFDYHPWPLGSLEAKKQARMTNRNNPNAKYGFRDFVNSSSTLNGKYNGVHSSDNEFDAWFYLSRIGEEYRKKIAGQVEIRRARYAANWGVVKLLSKGPVSKVELIKYGESLAVKKTFRPGEERLFNQELFAAGELSKELKFVPPLLEKGEGYLIVPYLENVLNRTTENEKKNIIFSKKEDILYVMSSLKSKGLVLSDFNPKNLIITPDDQLFCTGFSKLLRFQDGVLSNEIQEDGAPEKSEGDFTISRDPGIENFDQNWASYLEINQSDTENNRVGLQKGSIYLRN
jgi:hypothetical protein